MSFDNIFSDSFSTQNKYNKECTNKYNLLYGFVDKQMSIAKNATTKQESVELAAKSFIHIYRYIIKNQSLPKIVKDI